MGFSFFNMEIREVLYDNYQRADETYHKRAEETNPFKFKYEAKEILAEILEEFDDQNQLGDELEIAKGTLLYFIAKIDYETEDRPSAVKGFKASLAVLESYKFDPRAICCFMKGCNDIAVVHSEREEHDSAFAHLSNAK